METKNLKNSKPGTSRGGPRDSIKQLANEMYQEWADENKILKQTTMALELWSIGVKRKIPVMALEEIQGLIQGWSKNEWGDSTEIKFYPELLTAVVINKDRMLKKEFCFLKRNE